MDIERLIHGDNPETPSRMWLRAWATVYAVALLLAVPAFSEVTPRSIKYASFALIAAALLAPYLFVYYDIQQLRDAGIERGKIRFVDYLEPTRVAWGLIAYRESRDALLEEHYDLDLLPTERP